MEILIAISIVALAVFILYKSTKKRNSGDCECGSCSKHCALYKDKKINKD